MHGNRKDKRRLENVVLNAIKRCEVKILGVILLTTFMLTFLIHIIDVNRENERNQKNPSGSKNMKPSANA